MRLKSHADNKGFETMDMSNHPIAAPSAHARYSTGSCIFTNAPDPEAAWAIANPDRAMAFLFVSPRPCAALESLLSL